MSAFLRDGERLDDLQCNGLKLIQRPDDKEETVWNRIKVYEEQTAPLIAYYTERGMIVTVNGDQEIDDVTADIGKALK